MPITLDLETLSSDSSARKALNAISLAVAKSKKIVVVTGAGISCSCGIPDFRSSDGLYNLVKQRYPEAVLKGRDLFDSSLFRDPTSTSVFYTFISQLKRSIDKATPTPTHRFIKTLDTKSKLLRSYTQNIDGLESKVGLIGSESEEVRATGKGKGKIRAKEVKNVQLHGDIHRVRCTFCSAEMVCKEEHLRMFGEGEAPDCPECSARSEARLARSARALKIGSLRPAIVLYDEPHPLGDDIGSIQTTDINRKPDMLIIMGTSLKVHGFKKLVKDFARAVHAHCQTPLTPSSSPSTTPSPRKQGKKKESWVGKVVFVNKTAPGTEWEGVIDYWVKGSTDTWAEKTLEEWKKMRPTDWEIQKTLDGEGSTEGGFRAVKEVAKSKTKGAGKKKQALDTENIAPDTLHTFAQTQPPLKSLPTPPSSPSKRRQASSHYCAVECSPSKKRTISAKNVEFEERGMLFGDTTNTEDLGDGDALDLSEVDLRAGKLKRSKSRARKAVGSPETDKVKKGPRRKVDVFVELQAMSR